MRRLWIVLIIVIAVGLQPAARGQTRESCFPGDPPLAAVPSISFDTAVATQDRFNRYFHHDVVPRLVSCWAGRSA